MGLRKKSLCYQTYRPIRFIRASRNILLVDAHNSPDLNSFTTQRGTDTGETGMAFAIVLVTAAAEQCGLLASTCDLHVV